MERLRHVPIELALGMRFDFNGDQVLMQNRVQDQNSHGASTHVSCRSRKLSSLRCEGRAQNNFSESKRRLVHESGPLCISQEMREHITAELQSIAAARGSYVDGINPRSLASMRSTNMTDACLALYSTFASSEKEDTHGSRDVAVHEQSKTIRLRRGIAQSSDKATRQITKQAKQGKNSNSLELDIAFRRISTDFYAHAENRYLVFNESGAVAALKSGAILFADDRHLASHPRGELTS